MGKIKEAFGIIDGYQMGLIGKSKLKKEELFEEIKKLDENIIEECSKVMEGAGRVVTYEKDKSIKAIYLFEVEEKDKEKILKNTKTIYTDEISDELKERLDNRLVEEFKDMLLELQYRKIYLNDNVIQIDPKKSKKEIYKALFGGAAFGFIIGWICFDDVGLGFLWAVVFAGAFSGLDVVVSKKRGRKKDN